MIRAGKYITGKGLTPRVWGLQPVALKGWEGLIVAHM
jgi:hypothetical protein